MSTTAFKIIFLGDIVGKVGRLGLESVLSGLRKTEQPDIVIANGENASGGLGLDAKTADEIFASGVDLITSGNHIWKKKDINEHLEHPQSKIIRPYNYPEGAPGRGFVSATTASGVRIGVLNLIGRVFMTDSVDCPFQAFDRFIENPGVELDYLLVDFHAEATSEKVAMGYHCDGRATAVVGTHTHVQTADERILPDGTAFICDVGMCGPLESVIGMQKEVILERFLTGRPTKFEVAKGAALINGVVIECGGDEKKASAIRRIRIKYLSRSKK